MDSVIIEKLEGGRVPVQETRGSAGWDVFPRVKTKLVSGRQKIPLGFKVQLPEGWHMDVRSRSGMSLKGLKCFDEDGKEHRIDADVTLGLVDSDYRGEVNAIVKCGDIARYEKDFYVIPEESIAQVVYNYSPDLVFIYGKVGENYERGTQGFRS